MIKWCCFVEDLGRPSHLLNSQIERAAGWDDTLRQKPSRSTAPTVLSEAEDPVRELELLPEAEASRSRRRLGMLVARQLFVSTLPG